MLRGAISIAILKTQKYTLKTATDGLRQSLSCVNKYIFSPYFVVYSVVFVLGAEYRCVSL